MYSLLSLKTPRFGLKTSAIGLRDPGSLILSRQPNHLASTKRVLSVQGFLRVVMTKKESNFKLVPKACIQSHENVSQGYQKS